MFLSRTSLQISISFAGLILNVDFESIAAESISHLYRLVISRSGVTVAATAGWTAGADIETNSRMDAIKKVVTFISTDTMVGDVERRAVEISCR